MFRIAVERITIGKSISLYIVRYTLSGRPMKSLSGRIRVEARNQM